MGRRWGKTYMSGVLSAAVADHGGQVAWVVPTYANSRPAWRFIERLAAQSNRVHVLKAERRFEFPSGGFLGVYTADNDVSMRGEAFDLVIIDEAAQVREETWTDVIMPTLADKGGRAMLISTPKGRNWFWREFEHGRTDGRHQASFTAPSTANPLPAIQAAARMARDRVSERTYQQEWLAQFVADGAGVFRNVRALSTATPEPPIEGRQYVIGRDWARTNDASVSSVWDIAARREVALEVEQGLPFALQIARLQALAAKYNDALVIAEQNSLGDPLIEQAAAAGVRIMPFVTTNATKAAGVDALVLACERGAITLQDDERGILEMESFESSRTPLGMVKYAAPEGLHDDIVMARLFAYSGIADAGPVLLWE